MRLFKRILRKATLACFRVMLMKMKNVKNLDLRTRWSDDDDMKIVNDINGDDDMKAVNDMKDLGLKMFSFEILICLKRLRMSRAEKLIIESESNEKERWLDSKFKTLLLSCVLNSIFNNIIMIALSNRILNDSKFNKIAIWCFVIINLANVVIMIMLLWLLYVIARLLSFMIRHCEQINVS